LIVAIAAPASALVYGFRKPWKTLYPVMMILNAILLVWLFVMLVQYLGSANPTHLRTVGSSTSLSAVLWIEKNPDHEG
jgi:hypothetical protein